MASSTPQVRYGASRMPREPAEGAKGGRAPKAETAVPSESAAPRTLTDRQIEILIHVARGRTNRQVGQALGISERTVRNHLRTISHKLSASDRTHAVVLAIESGWIPIPIEPEEPVSQESNAARQRVSNSAKR